MDENSLEIAAKQAQREYARQWRRKNPDKIRDINRRYWQKKAAQKNSGNTGVEGGETD